MPTTLWLCAAASMGVVWERFFPLLVAMRQRSLPTAEQQNALKWDTFCYQQHALTLGLRFGLSFFKHFAQWLAIKDGERNTRKRYHDIP